MKSISTQMLLELKIEGLAAYLVHIGLKAYGNQNS